MKGIILAGGSGWTDAACEDLRRFAESCNIPVCSSFRRQDVVDNDSPAWIGDLGTGPNPKLLARVRESDLLLVIGAACTSMIVFSVIAIC